MNLLERLESMADRKRNWNVMIKPNQGQVTNAKVEKIDFAWVDDPPNHRTKTLKFTLEGSACLEVKKKTKIDFFLRSDSESELYLEKERILRHAPGHMPEEKFLSKIMTPGFYLMRAVYKSYMGAPTIAVKLSGENHEIHEFDSQPGKRCKR